MTHVEVKTIDQGFLLMTQPVSSCLVLLPSLRVLHGLLIFFLVFFLWILALRVFRGIDLLCFFLLSFRA